MVVVHGTVAVVDVAVIDWHSGNSRPLLVLQTFFSFLSNFLRRKQIKGNNLPFICVKLVPIPSSNFLENRSIRKQISRGSVCKNKLLSVLLVKIQHSLYV